nr:MAG: cysteine desulfurase [Hyphomicrobiales bacterium]
MAYLDHNATSPLLARAREAMLAVLDSAGNASSVHRPGRQARAQIEEAREKIAHLIGANSDSVVFTGGGSEANALALRGAVAGALTAEDRITRIFISAIEHESVRANALALSQSVAGIRLTELAVSSDGLVDLDAFRLHLIQGRGRTFISVMAANNETGVLQPIEALVAIARQECGGDALVHIDAAQFAGRLPISFDALKADYLTVSAHKFGGPQGVGALVVRDGAPLEPFSVGAQEMGRRGGTENVMAIVGFGAAAEEMLATSGDVERICGLRDRFETGLRRLGAELIIFGEHAKRLPNTSNFALCGLSAETALIALDLDGIALSSGAACSSGKVRSSHVLSAMGVDENLARCGLRVSLGPSNDDNDIEAALGALRRLIERKAHLNVAAA